MSGVSVALLPCAPVPASIPASPAPVPPSPLHLWPSAWWGGEVGWLHPRQRLVAVPDVPGDLPRPIRLAPKDVDAFDSLVDGVASVLGRERPMAGARPAASSGPFGNLMIQDPHEPSPARAPSNQGNAPIGQTRRLTRRPGAVIVPQLENRLPLWGPATFERRRGTLQRSGAPFSCEVSRRAR